MERRSKVATPNSFRKAADVSSAWMKAAALVLTLDSAATHTALVNIPSHPALSLVNMAFAAGGAGVSAALGVNLYRQLQKLSGPS